MSWWNDWAALSMFGAVLAAALLVGALSAFKSRLYGGAIGFAMLGSAIGLSVGLSLTPVVGVVLPAVLTFVGGLFAYLFSEREHSRQLVGPLLSAFCVMLIISLYAGAAFRTERLAAGQPIAIGTATTSASSNVAQGPFPAGGVTGVFAKITLSADVGSLTVVDNVDEQPIFSGAVVASEQQPAVLMFQAQDLSIFWPKSLSEEAIDVACLETAGWGALNNLPPQGEATIGMRARPCVRVESEISGEFVLTLTPQPIENGGHTR